MLAAIAAGEDDPRTLAQMAKAGLRKKLDELEHALSGRIKPHHRLLIQESLHLLRYLEGSIERLDLEIERLMAPYAAQQAALDAVPGLGAVAVAAVVAEIGVQMWRQTPVQQDHRRQRLAPPHPR